MISHKYKLIFVHINKTGGTSIETLFGGIPFNDQVTALEIQNQHGALWDQYFKFSIVRNPWDRMVSEYYFRKTSHIINPPKWRCPKHLRIPSNEPFKKWVLEDHDKPQSEYIRFRSQINWLLNSEGNLMVDFIGRFEKLARDVGKVCKTIGANLILPHYNYTHHLHYTHYYDQETKEIVAERHKEDIDLFKYQFGCKTFL
jgi:hypothetical protein